MRYVCYVGCFIALRAMAFIGTAQTREMKTKAPTRIHEAMFVSLNGVEQWITIRGDDVQNR